MHHCLLQRWAWHQIQPLFRAWLEWAPELRVALELLERLRARLLLQPHGTGLHPLAGLGGAPVILAGASARARDQRLPRSRQPFGQLLQAWGWCQHR